MTCKEMLKNDDFRVSFEEYVDTYAYSVMVNNAEAADEKIYFNKPKTIYHEY